MHHLELLRDLHHTTIEKAPHEQYVRAVRAAIPHVAAGCAVTRDYLIEVTNLDVTLEEAQLLSRVFQKGEVVRMCAREAAERRREKAKRKGQGKALLRALRETVLLGLLWEEHHPLSAVEDLVSPYAPKREDLVEAGEAPYRLEEALEQALCAETPNAEEEGLIKEAVSRLHPVDVLTEGLVSARLEDTGDKACERLAALLREAV